MSIGSMIWNCQDIFLVRTAIILLLSEKSLVITFFLLRGCSGLVVSLLDSGSRSLGSSPGRVIALCSWARHFILTVPLSTQEYIGKNNKWVLVNCQGNLTKCWKVTCNRLAYHPGGVAILLVASCYGNRPGINSRQQ